MNRCCSMLSIVMLMPVWINATEKKAEAAHIQQIPPFASHVMLIFLDDSETELESIGKEALVALYQKAAPILISSRLLKTVLFNSLTAATQQFVAYQTAMETTPKQDPAYKKYNHVIAGYKKFYAELQNYVDTINQTLATLITSSTATASEQDAIIDRLNKEFPHEKSIAITTKAKLAYIRSLARFNPDEWIIRMIPNTDDGLMLLIPQNYMPKIASKPPTTESFSEQELILGLKIDHMPVIKPDALFKLLGPLQAHKNPDYFMRGIWNNGTSGLFITRKELSALKIPREAMPQWALYMNGHGTIKEEIVSLQPQQFSQWLNFLETQIETKLLYYWSCYAAGTNSQLLFHDEQRGIDRTFSYAIVSGAAPEAVLYAHADLDFALEKFSRTDIDFTHKSLALKIHLNFNNFVQTITTADTIDFLALSNQLYPITTAEPSHGASTQAVMLRRLSQVKLPGIPWFNLIDSDHITVSLGEKLALSRDPTKPLNISTFFGTKNESLKPRIVLLYTQLIPFELIIPTKQIPVFASMVPGAAMHIFQKISVPQATLLSTLIQQFTRPAHEERLQKIYWIKKLTITILVPTAKSHEHELQALYQEYHRIQEEIPNLKYELAVQSSDKHMKQMLSRDIKNAYAQLQKIPQLIAAYYDKKVVHLTDLIIDATEPSPTIFYTRDGMLYQATQYLSIEDLREKKINQDYRPL